MIQLISYHPDSAFEHSTYIPQTRKEPNLMLGTRCNGSEGRIDDVRLSVLVHQGRSLENRLGTPLGCSVRISTPTCEPAACSANMGPMGDHQACLRQM